MTTLPQALHDARIGCHPCDHEADAERLTDALESDTRHRRISWTGEPDTCAVCGTEWPCDGSRADPDTGTDQTPTPDAIVPSPEARLAAVLRTLAHEMRWCKQSDMWHAVAHGHEAGNDEPEAAHGIAASLIAADPTIARHMALGAAVEESGVTALGIRLRRYRRDGLNPLQDDVFCAEAFTVIATLTAAIEEALRDD